MRNVEELLAERGIDICHETVRHWWNRFGQLFAADIRRKRVSRMRGFRQWQWHVDEVYVKINGEMHYLWRAVDQEGEVLESYVTKTRDKAAALRFMKKTLKRVLSEQCTGWRNARVRVGRFDAPPQETSQPVPLFQLLTRGDPVGGADVISPSIVAANC